MMFMVTTDLLDTLLMKNIILQILKNGSYYNGHILLSKLFIPLMNFSFPYYYAHGSINHGLPRYPILLDKVVGL